MLLPNALLPARAPVSLRRAARPFTLSPLRQGRADIAACNARRRDTRRPGRRQAPAETGHNQRKWTARRFRGQVFIQGWVRPGPGLR